MQRAPNLLLDVCEGGRRPVHAAGLSRNMPMAHSTIPLPEPSEWEDTFSQRLKLVFQRIMCAFRDPGNSSRHLGL